MESALHPVPVAIDKGIHGNFCFFLPAMDGITAACCNIRVAEYYAVILFGGCVGEQRIVFAVCQGNFGSGSLQAKAYQDCALCGSFPKILGHICKPGSHHRPAGDLGLPVVIQSPVPSVLGT